MSSPTGTPPKSESHWFGRFLRPTAGRILPALFRTRVLGRENIPEGGAVLAANHASYGDPILVWCVSPRVPRFMAKEELYESRIMRWGLPQVWVFPVRRGTADRESITRAGQILAEGNLVAMFPQGTRARDGEEPEAHGGVAFIAIRNDAPVVPVGIAGTDRIMPEGSRMLHFPRVTISFGAPIYPGEFSGGRKERVGAMTARIMERINEEHERAEGV